MTLLELSMQANINYFPRLGQIKHEYLRSRAYIRLSFSSPFSSPDRYSNLNTIKILVLLSWIPASKEFSIKSTYKSYRHILVLFVKGWKYILLWGHNNVWSWGCTQSIFHLLPFQIGQKTIHHRVWALFAHGQWSISTIVAMMQQKWRVGLAFFTLCSGHFHKKLVQTKTKLSLLLLMLKVHIKYNANLKLGHWEKRKKTWFNEEGKEDSQNPNGRVRTSSYNLRPKIE